MWNKNMTIQIKLLFWITITNFIAQVFYFFNLYYHNSSDLKRLLNLPMLSVFTLFLVAYILLIKRKRSGYWLMIIFLTAEFSFYFMNNIFSLIHGFGLFFQLGNPNLLLRTVFAIGYLNLFASGYFLFMLLFKRKSILITK